MRTPNLKWSNILQADCGAPARRCAPAELCSPMMVALALGSVCTDRPATPASDFESRYVGQDRSVPVFSQPEVASVLSLPADGESGSAAALERTGSINARSGTAQWWVVLGTFPVRDDGLWQTQVTERIRAQAEPCGLTPFSDLSDKFNGFRKGYMAVVTGPFVAHSDAEAARRAAIRCVPDAYVRRGNYVAEAASSP